MLNFNIVRVLVWSDESPAMTSLLPGVSHVKQPSILDVNGLVDPGVFIFQEFILVHFGNTLALGLATVKVRTHQFAYSLLQFSSKPGFKCDEIFNAP